VMINLYSQKIQEAKVQLNELEQYRGKIATTKSGHEVKIAANIGNITDLELVKQHDADAVGLFRSEFIYLEKQDYPTEEEQFDIYKTVLSELNPKQVVIRTLDIGADKTVDYFHLDKEENPALGYRAIRICLNEPELFKTQLRALYRASVYGNLAIMFPMITHLEQVTQIKQMIEEVKNELRMNHISYSDQVLVGIMIETPSAVMLSNELAKLVDFFSIGTNDLTQYTLAIDRMNQKLSPLFNPGYESILKMIELVCKNAHAAGIWVGICGESASDLSLLDFYLKIEIDELSISPGKVLRLKKEIINHE
jgi:phosphoenolpyruvate-protein phosphotransferase (PTS system enzyme I)